MTLGLDFEENGTFLGGNRNSCLVPGLVVRIPSHDLAPPPPPPQSVSSCFQSHGYLMRRLLPLLCPQSLRVGPLNTLLAGHVPWVGTSVRASRAPVIKASGLIHWTYLEASWQSFHTEVWPELFVLLTRKHGPVWPRGFL